MSQISSSGGGASTKGITTGSGTTVGATTADLVTISLGTTPTVYTITAEIAGFESTTPAGIGYSLICCARTNGIAATMVKIPDRTIFEESTLSACEATFVVSGNSVVVRVTGIAGLTVNWKALTISVGV